jgi:hypothetical protein
MQLQSQQPLPLNRVAECQPIQEQVSLPKRNKAGAALRGAFSTKLGGNVPNIAATNAKGFLGELTLAVVALSLRSSSAVAHQPFSVPHALSGQFVRVCRRMPC